MNTLKIPEKSSISPKTSFFAAFTDFLPLITAIIFLFLLVFLPDISGKSVRMSLNTCYFALLPSLFPFMVCGEIIFSLGCGSLSFGFAGKVFEKFTGINEKGFSVFLFGSLCGLPTGSKYALTLYKNGAISKSDCEKLMGVSNNAGLGFVVAGIGGAFFGSLLFGAVLYVCQVTASLITAHLLFGKQASVSVTKTLPPNKKKTFFVALTSAVSDASVNFVKICGFVIFFSTVSGFVGYFSQTFHLPVLFSATLISFFEITGACSSLAGIATEGSHVFACCVNILTFFAVGFSGISVHFQTCSLASEFNISMKKYFLTKLLSGVICAFLGAIFFVVSEF